jgi:hypothetical protein
MFANDRSVSCRDITYIRCAYVCIAQHARSPTDGSCIQLRLRGAYSAVLGAFKRTIFAGSCNKSIAFLHTVYVLWALCYGMLGWTSGPDQLGRGNTPYRTQGASQLAAIEQHQWHADSCIAVCAASSGPIPCAGCQLRCAHAVCCARLRRSPLGNSRASAMNCFLTAVTLSICARQVYRPRTVTIWRNTRSAGTSTCKSPCADAFYSLRLCRNSQSIRREQWLA